MKKEDIKTKEDALAYIDEIEKGIGTDKETIEALNSKIETLTKDGDNLKSEHSALKEKYYDLWLKSTQHVEEKKVEEQPKKSLDELLME